MENIINQLYNGLFDNLANSNVINKVNETKKKANR